MKQTHKFAAGVVTALSLGMAVAAAYAHPGQAGGGMGPQAKGGMQTGAEDGMRHGMKGGVGHGAMGSGAQHGAGAQLMTPEERTALQEKMRNARTPEERQQIATATRTEMQKRAAEKGITLPEGRGPRQGATTEHQH